MVYDEVEVHLVLMVMLLVDEVDEVIIVPHQPLDEAEVVVRQTIVSVDVHERSSNEIMVGLIILMDEVVEVELVVADIDQELVVMDELVEHELYQIYLEKNNAMLDDDEVDDAVVLKHPLHHMGLHIDDEHELNIIALVLMVLPHEVDEVVDLAQAIHDENELSE